jgi:hypothetical protein
MEMRSSPMRSMAPELNGGEGVGSSSWGATPTSGEAPGPVHGERGGVRCLGTDSVEENRGEYGASVRSCDAEAQRQWESRGGHTSWVLSIHQRRGGELDRGRNPGVHAAHRASPAHCAYPATHTHAGSTTQGPSWCAFGCVSSASRTGYVRLHHQAPGVVSCLVQRWRQQSSGGNMDTTLHGTSR